MIKSTSELVTGEYSTASEIFNLDPTKISKYAGFKKLKELHICRNLIESLDDMIGVVHLNRLCRLYVAGNPIMESYKPQPPVERFLNGKRVIFMPEVQVFNLFTKLANDYGIQISDPCYLNTKVPVEKPSIFVQPISVSQKPIIGKTKPTRDKKQLVHSMKPDSYHPSAIGSRLKHVLTETEIAFIIKSGKIPSLKMVRPSQLLSTKSPKNGLNDNSTSADATFLTGVNIATMLSKVDLEYLSSSDSDEDFDTPELVLPRSIQSSIKALRQALDHPISFWRVLKHSKSNDSSQYNGKASPRKKKTDISSPAKTVGAMRPNDDFDDMNQMMFLVNERLGEAQNRLGMSKLNS